MEGKESTHGRQLSPVKLSGKDEHSSTFPHMVSHTLAILYSPFDCFPAVDFCFVSEYPSKAHRLPTNCPKHFCAAGKLRKSGRNILFSFFLCAAHFCLRLAVWTKAMCHIPCVPQKVFGREETLATQLFDLGSFIFLLSFLYAPS